MRISLSVGAESQYQMYADQQGRTVEEVVVAQLERFKALPPGQKAIVIGGDTLARVEQALDFTAVDGKSLVDRLIAKTKVAFGGVEIPLTPGQIAEIQHRAQRQGKTPEALIKDMVAIVTRDLFWGTPGGVAATGDVAKVG